MSTVKSHRAHGERKSGGASKLDGTISRDGRINRSLTAAGILTLCISGWGSSASAAIAFTDVTATNGPFPVTESWGVTARDMDGDGWTDIFANNHRQRPHLYHNEGNGVFTDATLTIDKSDTFVSRPLADHHGVAWGDFDNDGDQDLWLSTGTCCDGQFLVNYGGYFYDEAVAWDLANDGGGRSAVWIDFSGDDYVDAIATQFTASRSKEQIPMTNFVNRNTFTGLDCGPRTNHVHVADFTTDGNADILCVDESKIDKLYDVTPYATVGDPFADMSSSMPSISLVPDTAVGDFDNNGQSDVFALRGLLRQMGVGIFGAANDRIEGRFDISDSAGGTPVGFTFQGGEQIDVVIHSEGYGAPRIFIGGTSGYNPTSQTFTLDSTDPLVQYDGTLNHDPLNGHRLYIGYNTTTNTWEFNGFQKISGSTRAYVEIDNLGVTGFSNEVLIGGGIGDGPRPSTLLMNANGTFTDEAGTRGLGGFISCSSVAEGDYDNDMDLDLYLVCRTGVSNTENLIYENDGTGVFSLVASGHGAGGPVGAAVGDVAGTGDAVATGDFNGDGYLDLFVANGLNLQPDRDGAQNYLYFNQGGTNHWIAIDLVATGSPRDALGARVFVTAGGVTQLREQGNGYHRWSQNDSRLHFGLASNATVDLIRVEWPSGEVNEFSTVAASSFYRITEGAGGLGNGTLDTVTLGAANELPGPQSGDECGEALYDHDFGPAILVWRDCGTDMFHIRAKGGREEQALIEFLGTVTGDQPIASATGFQLEGNDSLTISPADTVNFDLSVWFSQDDGVDIDATGQNQLCFELTAPADTRVLFGAERWPFKGAIDLLTMQPCAAALSVADLSVDEDAGMATVTITLSEPANGSVFVNYATSDGTATQGSDYTTTSGVAEILDSTTSTTFDIPLLDDSDVEGDETLTVTLSNPQNALLGDATATVTIVDDEGGVCGEPTFTAGSERGLFLWRDCTAPGPGTEWHMRVVSDGPTLTYEGVINGSGVLSVIGFSIEGSDTLDSTPGDSIVDYILKVGGTGQDGFQLDVPAGANACFDATVLPTGANIYVGAGRQMVSSPFDLATLGACGATIDVADLSVNEDAGNATVTITLSEPASGSVFVNYATSDGTATQGSDYTTTSGVAEILDGTSSTTFDIPLLDDSDVEGDETLTVTLSNPQNAVLGDATATVTIVDDEGGVCGEPAFTPGSERGLFLWRDCTAPGPGTEWHMRVVSDGPTVTYEGEISGSDVLSVTGFSIEASDTLDSAPGDAFVDYILKVGGGGQDGFQLDVPAGADACFDPTVLPAGANVYVGADRQMVSGAFDLATLGSCSATISVADLNVNEDAGNATVTINLSQPASGSVFVNYATSDGTATQGSDYTTTSGIAEILDGTSSTTFDIPLLDDSDVEGDETLTVTLSNPQNALLGDATATVTIVDDEGGVCGEPAFTPGSERGLFLWRDCTAPGPGAEWHARVISDGSSITYEGEVNGNGVLSATGFSLEGSDTLDSVPGDSLVDFVLTVGGGGRDGFQLDVPAGVDACFEATVLPAGANVYVGAGRQMVSGAFDLATLGSCSARIDVADVSVDEDAGNATVTIMLSEPANGSVFVDYDTTDGTATQGSDYTTTSGVAEIVDGTSSTTFDIPLLDDSDVEGDETLTVTLSNPQNALLGDATAVVTIVDDEGAICGEPSYSSGSELGVFVWRDCEAAGPDEIYHLRITGGGSSTTVTYGGLASADPSTTVLTTVGFSLEASDVVDSVPGDDQVDFTLNVLGGGQDGFQLNVPAGAQVCLDVDTLPSGATIEVGSGRMPVTAPFDLATLTTCTP